MSVARQVKAPPGDRRFRRVFDQATSLQVGFLNSLFEAALFMSVYVFTFFAVW